MSGFDRLTPGQDKTSDLHSRGLLTRHGHGAGGVPGADQQYVGVRDGPGLVR